MVKIRTKNKFGIFFVAIAVLLIASACTANNPAPAEPSQPEGKTELSSGKTYNVEITSAGFSPSTVEISKGDTVIFVNRDTKPHWPASAAHPTHTVYPEAGGCIGSKFDACKGLAQDETFSFQFNYNGTWKYHDHLNCCTDPAFFGTVIVK